jgi:zona occludens toxin (predicted ATPase)
MSVFYICGKPGGGKTYIGVKQICEELADPKSNRFIVTNIALKMPDLAEWCHRHCKHEVNLAERIRILDDIETGEFWLYEPGREFAKRREIQMRRRTMDVPDFEDRAERGCLYVIDEVHVYFGARDWQATGSDATFFLSQHRKLNCDVVMITQHPEQTDKALRRLAQEYMSVRNLMREPILGFNLGTLFGAFRYVRTLNSPQSPNPAAFESGFVSLNPEEIGKLYDTTAGVGIAGRVAPPSSPKRGRHIAWLLVPITAVILLGIYGFENIGTINKFLAHTMAHLFFHSPETTSQTPVLTTHDVLSTGNNFTLNATRMFGGGAPSVQPASQTANTNEDAGVYCTGYCVLGTDAMVFLSDGRTAFSAYGDIQSIRERRVCVFGDWFPIHNTIQIERDHPEMTYHAALSGFALPAASRTDMINHVAVADVVVLPNHDYRQNLHDIKTGGFAQDGSPASHSQSASSQY